MNGANKTKMYEDNRQNAITAISKAYAVIDGMMPYDVMDGYQSLLSVALESAKNWLDPQDEDLCAVWHNLGLATKFVQKVKTDEKYELKHLILQAYEYVAIMEGIEPKVRMHAIALYGKEIYPRIPYKELW